MATRTQVVDAARSWLGTPYQHQGRLKGVGVDCAGLIVCVVRDVGLSADDLQGYPRRPDGSLLGHCERQLEPVLPGEEDAGDVVLFHWNNSPVHLGLLTSKTHIIHAFAVNRRVVEHAIDDNWRANIVRFYHVPGVL